MNNSLSTAYNCIEDAITELERYSSNDVNNLVSSHQVDDAKKSVKITSGNGKELTVAFNSNVETGHCSLSVVDISTSEEVVCDKIDALESVLFTIADNLRESFGVSGSTFFDRFDMEVTKQATRRADKAQSALSANSFITKLGCDS